jgi:dTDP-4-amino-4,6-dideoxygalactose transaminase
MKIAEKNNLFVIEDVAQAIGADFTFSDKSVHKAGTIGDIGSTSFFPSKNLGCYGDGGALYTNDDILATRIRMIANHGQSVQYFHDKVGVNSRLDSIQAAILNEKLPYLDEYAKSRNELANFYDKAFANCPQLTTPYRKKSSTHVFHQYTLLLNGVNRDEFRKKLADKNVPSMIYYPIPLHNQKAYQDPRFSDADFPISTDLCKRVISLPMHTEMDTVQREYIVQSVLESI